jgi:aminopeptidase N
VSTTSWALSQVPTTTPGGAPTAALSNTAVRSRLGGSSDAIQVYEFEPTPVMSPYLLAVAAGALAQYNATSGSSTVGGNGSSMSNRGGGGGGSQPELRLWAAAGREGQLAAAAAVAPRAFAFYQSYLSVPQPAELAKFDMVAVPGRLGAMENWGLLMMDEGRFLVDEVGDAVWELWAAARLCVRPSLEEVGAVAVTGCI